MTNNAKTDVKTDLTPLTSACELLGKGYPPEYINQLNEAIAKIMGAKDDD